MFAYDCVKDDYKIVSSIHMHCRNDFNIYIYSLKDNSWSKIESSSQLPQDLIPVANKKKNSNSVYWFTPTDQLNTLLIMRFDISSNRYEEMTIPTNLKSSFLLSVFAVEGHLHVMMGGGSNRELDIWLVTVENCWTLLFRCPLNQYDSACYHDWPDYKRPLCYAYSRDGHKIMIVGPLNTPKRLMCFDLE
ncbi:hypothetical protein KSS87_008150, partial [Heliosperma pusillum]